MKLTNGTEVQIKHSTMKLTNGTEVQIKHSTMHGVVTGAKLDETTLEITYRVDYMDPAGTAQQRYFAADELEVL